MLGLVGDEMCGFAYNIDGENDDDYYDNGYEMMERKLCWSGYTVMINSLPDDVMDEYRPSKKKREKKG